MKKTLIAILATALLVSFAGCQGVQTTDPALESSASSSLAESASASSTAAPEGDAIEITFMMHNPPNTVGPQADAMNKRREEFLAAYPNVQVVDNSIPHDDFVVKIKSLMASDEMPDIFTMRGDMMIPLIENEQIKPVKEYLDKFPGWEEGFLPGAFGDFTVDGVQWGVPLQVQGCGYLFANTEILAECGVEKVPTTLAELKDAIVKVQANGNYVPIAMGNKGKAPIGDCIMSAMVDRYTGTEWFYNMKNGTGGAYTDPEFVMALQQLYDLGEMGAFNEDFNSLEQDQGMAIYGARKAAMAFNGSWATDWIEINCDEDLIKATKLELCPTVEGGKGDPRMFSGGAGWAWQISAKVEGEKQEKLIELIKYMTDETYAKYGIEGGYVRFPGKVPEGADYSNVKSVTMQYLESLSDSISGPNYYVLLEPALLEEFGNICQELAACSITAEQGAERMQKVYEQVWADK